MNREEMINAQLARLTAERERLADRLMQQSEHGPASTPAVVISDIRKARAEIRRIKETLRSWNIEYEDQPDDEEPPAQKQPLSTKALFVPNPVLFSDASIDLIASHLYEWKAVHTTVQGLLLSAIQIEKAIRLAERHLTEEIISYIEAMWYSSCSRRADKIIAVYDKLSFIHHEIIEGIHAIIVDKTIEQDIYILRPNDKENLIIFKRHFDELFDSLQEIMVVTDLNIIQIADYLKSKGAHN